MLGKGWTLPTYASCPKPAFRGWSHKIALVVAVVLCPLLISASPDARLLSSLYSVAVIGLFGISSVTTGSPGVLQHMM